ncbi:MAG: hypothetical protein WA966_01305 [Ornithinimicrobium sp.]
MTSRGSKFRDRALEVYELSETETELLTECSRLIDECERLHCVIEEDGARVSGSQGQPRVHPAIGELRQHRLALGRLLAQLGLPDVDDSSLQTPGQLRAAKAARERWRAHNELKSARG